MILSSTSVELATVARSDKTITTLMKWRTDMKLRTIVCALLGAGLLGAVLPAALATEKEKPSAEVEAKVAEVIKAAYPEVVIISMAKGNEDGLEVVGVAFTSKGNKMDADVTPDGILVGTEEAADIKTFPRAAAVALRKATKD